jgi:hypothetical protein
MSIKTTPYGFNPSLTAGLVLWLDASDATTITQTSGNITQWIDKSTSALTATAANNPTLVANVQNGFPGISFDGSSQYFNLGNNLNMGTNQIYIFVVSKFNSTADGAIIGKSLYGSQAARYSLIRSGAMIPLIEASGGAVNNSGLNSDTSTSARLLNMVWDRSNIYLYQNGSSVFSVGLSDSSNLTNGDSLLIGAYQNGSGGTPPVAGLYMNGYIHEILMYFTSTASPLGNTARQQIESYLAQKWGLTLGAGHPGLTSTVYRSTYLRNTVVKRNIATMTPFYTAFTPRQIGGLALWLDGADPAGTGVAPTSGATITSWKDKSGSANHFGTTSGTTTNILDNGKFGVNFPFGAVMTSANQITFTTSSQFFIVCKLLDPTGFAMILAFPNAVGISGTGDFSMRFNGGSLLGTQVGGDGNDLGNGTTYVNGNYNPNYTSTTYYNTYCMIDTAARTGGTSSLTLSSLLYGRSYTGYINEFLYFPAGITSTQRQQVESYLAQKWGLTSSLPGAHLNATQPAGAITTLSLANSRITIIPVLSITLKYTYTGSNQSFVVPSGVTSVNVYIWGAGGGAGLGGGGGAGCYVQGVLPVIPGETLTIVVGQGGGNKARALGKSYGGGGAGGGPDGGRSDIPSSQGGGRSAIVRSSTDLVTAAAGGGGRGGRGGRGRLVTGENGTGSATGGTQTAGGTNNGGLYIGGDANQDNSAAGGSGYYGGGGGGQDQAGGGGSCLTSNLALLPGESTYGTESSNGVLAPQTSSPYYNSDVAFGATSSYGYNYGSGGNGLVVVSFSSKTSVSLTYSRLILSAWYGSVAYRYGLDVTTTVNNAFGGNPSNTITLSLATFTDPQVGTTKYTFIVYMFNGIQKFSSAYAEGTVLTFSSLT